MKTKKEKILLHAIELFSQYSYAGVSTAKIATSAEVSEALIFRHYKSKRGLLKAIKTELQGRIEEMMQTTMSTSDPKEILRTVINSINHISESEYPFWKMQYKLKLEENYSTDTLMSPIISHVSQAFERLGYKHPDMEGYHLIEVLDAALKRKVNGDLPNSSYFDFLMERYGLN